VRLVSQADDGEELIVFGQIANSTQSVSPAVLVVVTVVVVVVVVVVVTVVMLVVVVMEFVEAETIVYHALVTVASITARGGHVAQRLEVVYGTFELV